MEYENTSDNDRYRDLILHIKALDVGLWDYDIDTDILHCDIRWYDLLGRTPGSIHRIEDFRAFIHPDDVDAATSIDLEQIAEMIALDQRYHVDFRVIRSDGKTRWWRSVACLLVDPETGHRRAVGCITDNTDFRLIDPALSRGIHPEAGNHAEGDGGMAEDAPPDGALSARELECLNWVSVGKTAWETAIIMGRSQRTIEFHLANATRRLSASNKIHAAVIAVRRGLI